MRQYRRLRITWRTAKGNPMGAFGGGWSWKLGAQGNRFWRHDTPATIIVSLIAIEIRFQIQHKKES